MSREDKRNPRMRWLLPTAIAIAMGSLLLPLPDLVARSHSLVVAAIHDFAHFPVFATVTFLACRHIEPSRTPGYALILISVVSFSALMELGQSIVGTRDPSWSDLSTNTLGAIAGIAMWIAMAARSKPGTTRVQALAGIALLAGTIAAVTPSITPISIQFAQSSAFPILYRSSFPGTAILAESLGALDEVELEVVGDTLKVGLLRSEPVGIVLWRFQPDWTGFDALVVDIENTEAKELPMQLDVRDYASSNEATDRFSLTFNLRGNERRLIRVNLDAIANGPSERDLELNDVSLISLYRIAAGSDGFAVHEVRLE